MRRIERAVEMLVLGPLFDSYLGVGKKALPPDLLLKAVLYEMHSKRPSPAQWTKDVRESEPVRWLLFGLEPSRARLYDFRDRLAPFWPGWNAQVLHVALEENLTPATRVALDGSSVAAHASRHRLLNETTLKQRLRQLLDAIAAKVGVALFPDDGDSAETLFRNAEAALSRPMGRAARRSFQDRTTPTVKRTSIAPATMR